MSELTLNKTKYSKDFVSEIYNLPLLELVYKAQTIHRESQPLNKVQLCTLGNIKSGIF